MVKYKYLCEDKLNVTVRPTMVTWYSFGQVSEYLQYLHNKYLHTVQVQRVIKSKYRDQARPGTVPTFREFVKYLVRITKCQDVQ